MKAPRTQKPLIRRLLHAGSRAIRGILAIKDTPHRISWGVAIGTFVAYLPIVGIQMLIGAAICKLCKANVLASLPLAWITNPLTIAPIYFGLFLLGGVFTGDTMTYTDMIALIEEINKAGIFSMDGLSTTVGLFANIFWPIFIGGVIVGIVNGALFYYLTLKLITAYQKKRAERKSKWHAISQGHITAIEPSQKVNVQPDTQDRE